MALKKIEIYIEDMGDRNCPSCKADGESLFLATPTLRHNRTEMSLSGHCQECGCDFIFTYVLFLGDITYA